MATTTSTRKTGECKWFNSKKGYGFLTPDDGTEDVFVHQTAIHAAGFRSLAEKEKVEFDVTKDENGRIKAINVTGPTGEVVQGAPKPRFRNFNRRQNGDGNGDGQPMRGGRGGGRGGRGGRGRGQSSPNAGASAGNGSPSAQ
jgi:cold shock CspA family protein